MSNTHNLPDVMHELQAIHGDMLAAVILSTTWPGVPAPPSLTFAPFSTAGFVRDGQDLIYVNQAPAPLTLTGADGTYWLALHRNLWAAAASWTRQAGTHYLWRPSGTFPDHPAQGLVFASVTVAGGAITGVTPYAPAAGPPLSRQTAGNVAVTGGTITGLGTLGATEGQLGTLGLGRPPDPAYSLATAGQIHVGNNVIVIGTLTASALVVPNASGNGMIALASSLAEAGGTSRYFLNGSGDAPSYLAGRLGFGIAPPAGRRVTLHYPKASEYAILIQPSDNDTGPGQPMAFNNAAGGNVGSIQTTATATNYATSSDMRLKHNIQPLTNVLECIRALRPISHLWNADGSYGEGFLAHELMQQVPLAVTGEPDAVNDDGSVKPQQVDHSKLIPRLTAGIQELLGLVESLTARVTTLEQALGR